MDLTERIKKQMEVNRIFTPTTPVDESSLFSGRQQQLGRVVEAVAQKGQHVVIYGERGVGKTSLSNVLGQFLSGQSSVVIAPRATADSGDSFSSLWRKVFSEITITNNKQTIGFTADKLFSQQTLSDQIQGEITPDVVRRILSQVGTQSLLIPIVDEFDRLDISVTTAIADTVKMLSDHAVPATIVLVGVADSVDQLIKEHASVERALVQVPMPRMSGQEIRGIIVNGLARLGMTATEDALEHVVLLSQGLPHYTHLLGLNGTLNAVEEDSTEVTAQHIEKAVIKSVETTQSSIRSAYSKATSSNRAENLYGHVLLACAMTEPDELGFFAPGAVREPMSILMGKQYDIPSFARHLYDFTEEEKGPILERIGTERKYRYRFKNPLIQPYVIMKGLADGKISQEALESFLKRR
ncbi:TPA: AAA family ATPase [Pseudomonas aeruginosa]|uniref:ATP-binding protein n=3 Tax=Pseudomonas aeruginosa TaxID=287 RepID=UPI000F862D7D|nr:ATP-binding protein [Pseudomonas aeruginosa]MBG6444857.1 ATP-binding protein [Pseudomonas aeruginosa]MCO2343193.1 ATP-binding protein [Pseudomonas aeruginosa]RUF86135.1 ATP-binding protein [Pseudomonas aeruginosa]TYT02603.1 ATP-binding protein [Pseudomonas aeruginosa]HBO3630043.1 ATP-binding protein [Pseudomonas aeruginosa]